MKAFDKLVALAIVPAAIISYPAEAQAATVSFSGTVINSCVINISTPGVLGLATSGTQLSSDISGGVNSILAIVATGSTPTIQFGAPTLTGPAGRGIADELGRARNARGGAAQALTASASSYTMNRLLDTLTVKAEADNSSGFASGNYAVAATVTCQQS